MGELADFFQHVVNETEPLISHYGYAALFVIVGLEALGAPLPGETMLIGSSLLAARGDFNVLLVVLFVWVGAVAGDCTGYAIGRAGGRPLVTRLGRHVGLTAGRLASFEALFRRRGVWIVIIARFVVLLRQVNGIVAGVVRMPWYAFLVANAVGAFLWSFAWGFGPFLAVRAIGAAVR